MQRLLGAYSATAQKGFVATLDAEYQDIFGEKGLDEDMPFEFHKYTIGELETALWNTFVLS